VEQQMPNVTGRPAGSTHRARRAPFVVLAAATVMLVTSCETTEQVAVEPDVTVAAQGPVRSTSDSSDLDPTTTARPDCDDVDQLALLARTYRELPGVDPALLSLDVYGPLPPAECAPVPVVVYVHGGDFTDGDKSDGLDARVRALNAAGYAVVNVNHRLPDGRQGAGRVRFPDQADDVAAAVAWTIEQAPRFVADPARLALVGQTAGAFLAAQLATDPAHLRRAGADPAVVRCVAMIDPEPLDVVAAIDGGAEVGERYRVLFGDDAQTWRRASPTLMASEHELTAEFLVVTPDDMARAAPATRFVEVVRDRGAAVDHVVIPGSPVPEGAMSIGRPGDRALTPAVIEFLDRCLA
jgi:arylformamidase